MCGWLTPIGRAPLGGYIFGEREIVPALKSHNKRAGSRCEGPQPHSAADYFIASLALKCAPQLVTPSRTERFFSPNMPKSGKRRSFKAEEEDDSLVPDMAPGHSQLEAAASPRHAVPHPPPLKLPAFWESSPAAWFVHAESLFALHCLKDDELQYHHVVAALPSAVAARLVGLLTRPPESDKYVTLKSRLLYSFTLSDAERANELFSLNGLGARRPSELMEHMLGLLGAHEPGFLFHHLFLRQLPTPVRAALANTPATDMRTFATEADKFYLAGRGEDAKAPATTQAAPAREKKKGRDAATVSPKSRRTDLCFYHDKFGQLAKRCIPPCNFAVQGNAVAGAQ